MSNDKFFWEFKDQPTQFFISLLVIGEYRIYSYITKAKNKNNINKIGFKIIFFLWFYETHKLKSDFIAKTLISLCRYMTFKLKS